MGLIEEHSDLKRRLDIIDQMLARMIRDAQQLVDDAKAINKAVYEVIPPAAVMECPECGRFYTKAEEEAVWFGGKCGLCL